MKQLSNGELIAITTIAITAIVSLAIIVKTALTYIENVIKGREWNKVPEGTFVAAFWITISAIAVILVILILTFHYI